ncbi:exosome complex protein Rrp42 [Candidatus Woesearchaeota archaeon]|nr:exosome complex protein Rrp42 [Candidatus Woesearchaeota archaeon]MBW3016199.1 exosome complex protein Rrp42 [Candidatus Woesearchaeota archaeon]
MHQELKTHLLKALTKDVRYDGRKKLEYRPITVEYGVTKSAEGSARVKIGGTEVMAGVKMETTEPYPDTPDQGNLMVNAELIPLSNPEFESGPPGEQAIELARVVDRAIRESKCIDTHKLVITSGELVWGINIDICTINDEGNLLDASCLAAMAALKDARLPKLKSNKDINYDEPLTEEKLPLTKEPVEVTVIKVGDQFFVDPLTAEEKVVDARLTVAVTEKGTVCALQKGGAQPLSPEEIDKMIETAQALAPSLRKAL